MSTIIRIKENENLAQMLAILQSTIYSGLDKTEIIRSLIAEKVWLIKTQTPTNTTNLFKLDPLTQQKIATAYQSHQEGKSITVKPQEIGSVLENLAK